MPEVQGDMSAINVGDVVQFPKHAGSKVIELRPASVVLSHGAAFNFKVVSIDDRGIGLEKLTDPVHWIVDGVNKCGHDGNGVTVDSPFSGNALLITCGDCAVHWSYSVSLDGA